MQASKDTFGDTEMSMVIAPGEVCEKIFGEIDFQNECLKFYLQALV